MRTELMDRATGRTGSSTARGGTAGGMASDSLRMRILWQHVERYVARKGAAGCPGHLDRAGGGSVGTVVEIAVPEGLTVNAAAVPLNVTLVAPVRSVPKIVTAVATLPDVGSVFANGPKPTDRL